MSKNDKLLEIANKVTEEVKKERKVLKKVKMKPETTKMHQEALNLTLQARDLLRKADAIRDEVWGRVKREHNAYNYDLNISADGKELTIFAD